MDPSDPNNPTVTSARRRPWKAYLLAACVFVGGPAVALGVPDKIRIPIAKPHGAGEPPDSALFSHWQHDFYSCASCHPSTFPQRKLGFTHAEMEQGRFCGSCHDGQIAFSPKTKGIDCETCHVPTKKRDINEDELWD